MPPYLQSWSVFGMILMLTSHDNRNMAAVSWSSDKVKTMFLNPSPVVDSNDEPTAPNTSASPTSESEVTGGKKSSNVGAIAGGVVAGVAGLALLGGLLFYFLRKSKKNKTSGPDSEYSPVGHGGEVGHQHPIRPFPKANTELVTAEKPVEVYAAPGELPTENDHHWELDGTNTQVERIDPRRYA